MTDPKEQIKKLGQEVIDSTQHIINEIDHATTADALEDLGCEAMEVERHASDLESVLADLFTEKEREGGA